MNASRPLSALLHTRDSASRDKMIQAWVMRLDLILSLPRPISMGCMLVNWRGLSTNEFSLEHPPPPQQEVFVIRLVICDADERIGVQVVGGRAFLGKDFVDVRDEVGAAAPFEQVDLRRGGH